MANNDLQMNPLPRVLAALLVMCASTSPAATNLLINGDFALGAAKGGFDVATNDCPGWRNAGATYVDTGTAGLAWCNGGDGGGYQLTGYPLRAGDQITLTWSANQSWARRFRPCACWAPAPPIRLMPPPRPSHQRTAAWTPIGPNTPSITQSSRRTSGNTPASSLPIRGAPTYAQFDHFNLTVTPIIAQFIAGADMSLLSFFESKGIAYKSNGITQDALTTLKNQGVNCIRLRLFTSSQTQAQSDPYDYINNTNYTIPLAVRVKNAGLLLLLDLHYSDTWADPNHQTTPAAWTNLDFPSLVTQLRNYNSNCIAAFQSAGAPPDFVQIGNEITGGLLWTNGQLYGGLDVTAQWPKLGQLLSAAARESRTPPAAIRPRSLSISTAAAT